jgi:hypothetical protein
MLATEAERLIVDGFAIRFCVFVDICEEDCEALDISAPVALSMVRRAAKLSETVNAFFNEASGSLCIG